MSLFKFLTKPDRSQTQLAYMIRYWPYADLSRAGRELLHGQQKRYLPKQRIVDNTTYDGQIMRWNGRDYHIVWAYNNMPTEIEWNKRDDDTFIACEFRTSPAIEGFAVVILSFELPSTRLIPHAQGAFVS